MAGSTIQQERVGNGPMRRGRQDPAEPEPERDSVTADGTPLRLIQRAGVDAGLLARCHKRKGVLSNEEVPGALFLGLRE